VGYHKSSLRGEKRLPTRNLPISTAFEYTMIDQICRSYEDVRKDVQLIHHETVNADGALDVAYQRANQEGQATFSLFIRQKCSLSPFVRPESRWKGHGGVAPHCLWNEKEPN
jgi:hypothetical protein